MRYGIIGFLIMLIGCGTDTPLEPEEEPLNQDEALALLLGVKGLVLDSTLTIIEVVSEAVAVLGCPDGGEFKGTVHVIEEQDDSLATLTISMTTEPLECGITVEGYPFTVSGIVEDAISISIVGFFEQITIDGTTIGTIDWKLGERDGTCEIEMILHAEPKLGPTVDDVEIDGSYAGTVCGLAVEFDAPDQLLGGGINNPQAIGG